jgi:signal transduction histidine kinase
MKGTPALVALAVVTGIIISLPQEPWDTLMPVAWPFPILLWLAALCRPVFAAAGTLMVSLTIVWTTILGIGHFGKGGLPISERILQAQVVILVVAIFALAIAALFAERRANEARLIRSNRMLERERDNKLINAQAVTASIAHEVRQPLSAIVNNANAALVYLEKAPPDDDDARAAVNDIISDGHRANEVFHEIRALFEKIPQGRQWIDVNEIIVGGLRSLREEFKNHGVTTHPELSPELPLISGHKNQLEHVIVNLIQNALEAMDIITDRSRGLQLSTKLRGRDAIVVAVEDSGPGIDPKQLEGIFGAFFTTKSHGMGLGLAICRMIIEQHGGQLTASSDGKNGTQFQLVLPIEFTETAAAQ